MARSTTGSVEAVTYLQIKPEWGWAMGDDEAPVRSARIVRATQTRPRKIEPDCILVKINVQVPKGAFYPLEPVATVVIPEGLIEAPVIEVAAEDPQ